MKYYFVTFLILLLTNCSSNNTDGTENVLSNSKDNNALKIIDNKAWIGNWSRNIRQNEASLEITKSANDSIEFNLSASSGGNTGELEGVARISNNIAKYYMIEGEDTCIITFEFNNSEIIVRQEKGNCGAGLGVTYDGNYSKFNKEDKEIPEDTTNLISLGIFQNEKEDKDFRNLVGSRYETFINSTQLTYEDEDLDSLNAKVFSSGVRGLYTFMENIIMIDTLDNIWAAVIDDNKVYYYTNNSKFKSKLPLTIENWRKDFDKYEVIYSK